MTAPIVILVGLSIAAAGLIFTRTADRSTTPAAKARVGTGLFRAWSLACAVYWFGALIVGLEEIPVQEQALVTTIVSVTTSAALLWAPVALVGIALCGLGRLETLAGIDPVKTAKPIRTGGGQRGALSRLRRRRAHLRRSKGPDLATEVPEDPAP